MSNRAELLKSIIKEDPSLDRYLLSRGINPKFATKDQKVAHSKTGQFIKWKKDHMLESMTTIHTPAGKKQQALNKSIHVNKEIRTDGHEHLHSEAVDKKDTVTLDIPLLIRVLELAREDIKTDMDLHRVVEKLINIRTKGMLTMKDYNYIAKIHEDIMSQVSSEIIEEAMKTPKDEKEWEKVAQTRSEIWRRKQVKKIDENHIAVAMGKELDDEGSMIMNQLDQMERSINMMRDVVKDPKMQVPAWVQSKVTLAADYIETVAGYMSSKNEEVEDVTEGIEDTIAAFNRNRPSHAQAKVDTRTSAQRKADTDKMLANRAAAKPKVTPKPLEKKTPEQSKKDIESQIAKSYASHRPGQYVGDSVEHDGTPMVEAKSAALRFQQALQREKSKREEQERKDAESKARAEKLLNPPKPVSESRVSAMSKSARMIKSIYKKKGMKEETYDHEKEDKSVASYGKKPKVTTIDPKQSMGEKKPDAAAILTGGTTLTGQPRDTVEIDPMMRKRPGPDIPGKKN
jgi:hypothetical protein